MSRRITDLQAQKRNSNRVNVFLDGEFAFGLSRITAAWLRIGQELSAEKINQLQSDDEREVALQRAMRQLERRERTEAEIKKNLSRHGYPDSVIDAVIDRLKQNGLVDDNRYAQMWIENQSQFRPRSRKALAYEMRQRGVQREVIEQALNEITTDDEEALAYQAAAKQVRKLGGLEWKDFRVKLGGFLARRGFSYEVSEPVIRRSWETLHHTRQDESSDVDL